VSWLAALALALQAAPAAAQPAPAPANEAPIAEGEDILVTGMGQNGYRLTADQLRDAVRAFQQHRATFAPQASLRWQILPAAEAAGLEIRLVSGAERIAVPVDANGTFTLPAERILGGNWRLQTNAGRRQIRIRPSTFSPGGSDAEFRMGDARLLCRVYWAFANNQFSVIQRAMFGAVGGCGSRRVAIWYSSDRPVSSVTAGAINFEVREGGNAYRPLLHDRTIDDGVRVRVTYR
jgi:hypothetical protein